MPIMDKSVIDHLWKVYKNGLLLDDQGEDSDSKTSENLFELRDAFCVGAMSVFMILQDAQGNADLKASLEMRLRAETFNYLNLVKARESVENDSLN